MPTAECVLFDAMNTLIYPDPPVFAAYREAAARQGAEIAPEIIRARFRAAFREEEERDRRHDLSTGEEREVRRWRDLVAATLPELPDPERGFRELWDHFARPESWRCYEDVAPTLRELEARNVPWGIASNFDSRLRAVAAGLPELAGPGVKFAVSSEIGWKKPHPAFFRQAASLLGVPADRILFAGDDWINDAQGASQTGMRAVLIARGAEDFARGQADPQQSGIVIRDLRELIQRLDDAR